jgi:hypothetical protein
LHFFLISGDHTNVETQFSELLAETKAKTITATCDNSPSIGTVPLNEVFGRYDKFDKIP